MTTRLKDYYNDKSVAQVAERLINAATSIQSSERNPKAFPGATGLEADDMLKAVSTLLLRRSQPNENLEADANSIAVFRVLNSLSPEDIEGLFVDSSSTTAPVARVNFAEGLLYIKARLGSEEARPFIP
jgi:hypothetical protein